MDDNASREKGRREYSADRNYNKTISTPNYNVKNTLNINMQSIDSINLKNMQRSEKVKKELIEKKEELIPEISEIYGNKEKSEKTSSSKKELSRGLSSKEMSLDFTKKIAPENFVAIITVGLIVFFMIMTAIIYNVFTS